MNRILKAKQEYRAMRQSWTSNAGALYASDVVEIMLQYDRPGFNAICDALEAGFAIGYKKGVKDQKNGKAWNGSRKTSERPAADLLEQETPEQIHAGRASEDGQANPEDLQKTSEPSAAAPDPEHHNQERTPLKITSMTVITDAPEDKPLKIQESIHKNGSATLLIIAASQEEALKAANDYFAGNAENITRFFDYE